MPQMSRLHKQNIARKLGDNFDRQVELLNEAAAAYRHEGRPVPQEIGEAIGAVVHRRHAFDAFKRVWLETSSGIGVKPVLERFLGSIREDNATIQRALTVLSETTR